MTQPTTNTSADQLEKSKNTPDILTQGGIDIKDFGDFTNQDNINNKKKNTNTVISNRLKTPENIEKGLEALGIAFNEKLSKLETNEDWISSNKNDGILNFLGFALITAISDFREAGKTEEITLENLLSEQQVTQHSRVKQSLEILQKVFGKQNLPQNSSGQIIQNNWDSYITIIDNDVKDLMKVPSDKLESVFGTGGTMIGAGIGAWAGKGSGAFTGTGKTILYSGAGAIMGKSIEEAVKKWDSSKTLSENVGKMALDSAKNIFKNGFNVFEQGKEKWKTSTQDEKIGIGAMGLAAAFASSYFFRNGLPSFGGSKNEKSGSGFLGKLFSGKGLAGILLAIATFFGLSKTAWGKGVMDEMKNNANDFIGQDVDNQEITQNNKSQILQNLKNLKNENEGKEKFINAIVAIEKNIQKIQNNKTKIPSRLFRHLATAAIEDKISPPPTNSYDKKNNTYTLSFGNITFSDLVENPFLQETLEQLSDKRTEQILKGMNNLENEISDKLNNRNALDIINNIKSKVSQNGYTKFTSQDLETLKNELKPLNLEIKETNNGALTIKSSTFSSEITVGVNPNTSAKEYEQNIEKIDKSFLELVSIENKNMYKGMMGEMAKDLENAIKNGKIKDSEKIKDVIRRLKDGETFDSLSTLLTLLGIIEKDPKNKYFGYAFSKDTNNETALMIKIGAMNYPFQVGGKFLDKASHLLSGEFKEFLAQQSSEIISPVFLTAGFASQFTHAIGNKIDKKNAGILRKIAGKGIKGVVMIPRALFWQLPLSPYYLAKGSYKAIEKGINVARTTKPLVRGVLEPSALIYKTKENQKGKFESRKAMLKFLSLPRSERKLIVLMEQRLLLERNRILYLNGKGDSKWFLDKKLKKLDSLLADNKSEFEKYQRRVPKNHKWYIDTMDIEKYSRNHETVKETEKRLKQNKNTTIPETPTDEKKKPTNATKEKKKKPTVTVKPKKPLNKSNILSFKGSKSSPSKDYPKLKMTADGGPIIPAKPNPNEIKKPSEKPLTAREIAYKRWGMNSNEKKIPAIEKQPFYSELPEGEKKLLSRSVTTIAKYAGTVGALAIIVRMAESENPQMAAVEAAGVMASLTPALLKPSHPFFKAVQVVAIILFGAAAVKFAEDVSNAIDGKVDEWGISKGYYEKTDSLSELTGRLISPFMDIWDNGIVDNFAKGDNAYSYFSDTSYNSNIAGNKDWGGYDFDSIKSVYRGKEKIEEWNTHIRNRILKEKKSLEDSQSEFNKLTSNEKNIAKKKYAEYNKKYEITGDEDPDEIIKITKEKEKYLKGLYYGDRTYGDFSGHRFLITQDNIKKRIPSLETQIINNNYIINQRKLLDNDLKTILNTFSKKEKENIKVSEYRMLRKALRRMQTYINMGIFSEIVNNNEENDSSSIAMRWNTFRDLDIIKNPKNLPYGIYNEIYVLKKLFSYRDAKIENSSKVEAIE